MRPAYNPTQTVGHIRRSQLWQFSKPGNPLCYNTFEPITVLIVKWSGDILCNKVIRAPIIIAGPRQCPSRALRPRRPATAHRHVYRSLRTGSGMMSIRTVTNFLREPTMDRSKRKDD